MFSGELFLRQAGDATPGGKTKAARPWYKRHGWWLVAAILIVMGISAALTVIRGYGGSADKPSLHSADARRLPS